MKTLSVALIVKNEQDVLGRILSDCTFCDQLIVVDTGSTDNTVQIAKQFGAEVYYFEWIDDFSSARNFAFSKATCDFVMWLDADDRVTAENQQKIKDWKANNDSFDTLMCRYCTGFDQDGNVNFWFFRERIVRNCPFAHWNGRVHEAITPFGNVGYADIEVLHKPLTAHTNRNLKIYKKMLKEKVVFEQRELYYFGRELFYSGQNKKALSILKKFVKNSGGFYVDKAEALKILHTIYLRLNDKQKAIQCLTQTFLHIRPRSDICCLLGHIYFESKQLDKAIDWYKLAIECTSNEGFVDADMCDFVPYVQLCLCYFSKGMQKQAYEYHCLARQLKPSSPIVQYNENFFSSHKVE